MPLGWAPNPLGLAESGGPACVFSDSSLRMEFGQGDTQAGQLLYDLNEGGGTHSSR
jgi:hypothetical protein